MATGDKLVTVDEVKLVHDMKLNKDFSAMTALPTTIATGDLLTVESNGTNYKIDYNALATAILNKIGAGSDNIVDIANGGTGATSVSAARSNLNVVNKSGDTMSGALNFSSTLNTATRPSTDQGITRLQYFDTDGAIIGGIRETHQKNDGALYNKLITRRSVGNQIYTNELGPGVSESGANIYKVTDSAAFRSAIGVQSSSFSVYNSVTELGLTSGSTTILAAFNAMGTNAILICPAGEFASGEMPITYGTVEIAIPSASARSYIHFYGKDSSDYRMYLSATTYNGNNGNLPSGDWVKLITIDNVYNGLDKTASGSALDARQGKALSDTLTMVGNGAFNLGSIGIGASKELKASTSTHAMLVLSGPNINLFGLYLIRLGTDMPNTVTVTQGSNVTFTPSTGKITIGNTSSNGSMAVNIIPLNRDSSYFTLT